MRPIDAIISRRGTEGFRISRSRAQDDDRAVVTGVTRVGCRYPVRRTLMDDPARSAYVESRVARWKEPS